MKKLFAILICAIMCVTLLASCEHRHTYGELKGYDEGHCRPYTCGCPYPIVLDDHIDEDKNGKCDDCEYTMNANSTDSEPVMLNDILQRLPYGYNVDGFIEKYDLYDNGKYYFVDNPADYCELLSDIGVPFEGPFDTLFEEKVMLCYLRCVSGSADFIPVEYFYDGNTNKIECKTIYQPEPDINFPAVEICWCVDLVEVPKSIFEQLGEG